MTNQRTRVWIAVGVVVVIAAAGVCGAEEFPKPYSPPCVERENVFEFTEKPKVKNLGNDKYEITFAVKGNCDVTVGVVDEQGKVVRHLGSGVLGANAPAPFQKNALKQTIYWNGKDDLDVYHKEPGKLKVRVMLGLKPEFDKLLGWHEYDAMTWDEMNVYRAYRALDADESGVYVLSSSRPQLRQYDHDGKYVRTILPPAADVPVEQLTGLTALEIEPGRRVPHAPSPFTGSPSTLAGGGGFMEPGIPLGQHARVRDGWFVFVSGSPFGVHRLNLKTGAWGEPARTWEIPTRNAADLKNERIGYTKLAFSPDGKHLYVSGLYDTWYGPSSFAVHRLGLAEAEPRTVFAGSPKEPGQDGAHFQRPEGLDVDAQGRVYVCDLNNNRVQVFSADAKLLKTIPLRQPYLVRVDRQRGGIYVLQIAGGGSEANRTQLVRLKSFEEPSPLFSVPTGNLEGIYSKKNSELLMTVDAWAPRPRIWLTPDPFNIQVWEDRDKEFVKCLDFQEETKKAGLAPLMMNATQWGAVIASKVTADPTRARLYYHGMARDALVYDLSTGKHEYLRLPSADFYSDRAVDARGFLYTHVIGAVTRHDPVLDYRELAFDYGTPGTDSAQELYVGKCVGVLPLKDQGNSRGFENGLGVNAWGDVAVSSSVFYVPKYEDAQASDLALGEGGTEGGFNNLATHRKTAYAAWQEGLQKRLKRGEAVYSVKATPGRLLSGDTIWVFDRRGELTGEDVIPGLGLVGGVQIDAAGSLYTMFNKARMVGGRPFLSGRLSVVGAAGTKGADPATGTLLKAPPKGARVCSRQAPIAMDPWPNRPMDVEGGWVEGAEWLYAGVGPVGNSPLSSARHCTDWYGRSFVPEAYRYSVGILDSNGNLVMHLGRYGNADSGRGPRSPVKIGGDEVAFARILGLTATDAYLCVCDLGNIRIVVLKLGYHAEESVGIQ